MWDLKPVSIIEMGVEISDHSTIESSNSGSLFKALTETGIHDGINSYQIRTLVSFCNSTNACN